MRRAAALLLAGIICCSSTYGAQRPLTINIAPGSLQQALQRLSELAAIQILYEPTLVQGRLTRGVQGTLAPEQALARLLAATDIAFSFTAVDAVALFRKPDPTPAAAARGVQQEVSPRIVTISADRNSENSYNSTVGMTATKVDESALIVPLASQSLTSAILRDRHVNRLQDALEYVSAAEVAPNGQSALGFIIRGFPTYQYYLDGVRVSPDLHHDGFRDLANIERIDVLKGPSSLLYGRMEPGGAINVITKQPLTEPHFAWEQQAGSFGRERTELDAGGPLSAADGVFYRLNAAYEDERSFRNIPNRRVFVAPAVTWNLSESTSLTGYGEFLDSHDFHDSGLPVLGDRMPPVPVQRSLEEGGEVHTTDVRVGVKGSHTFEDGWILRLHLDARWIQSPRAPGLSLSDDGIDPAACTPSTCPVQRELVAQPESRGNTYFVSADALRDFHLWGTRNSVLTGLDLFQSLEYSELATVSLPTLAVDLFNPRPAAIPSFLLHDDPSWSSHDTTVERWGGLYAQDQVQLGDSWYFLVGARYDFVVENIDNQILAAGYPYFAYYSGGGRHKVDAIKGRVGLLWHPKSSLSLYANYTQNFGVTAGLYTSGNGGQQLFLPAEIADEFEAGLKLEAADGRACASLAVFDLSKRNIASPVLEPAIDNASVQYLIHAATNMGLEADFRGEVASGLQVLANYAYIHSRIDNEPYGWVGTPPKGAELLGPTGNQLAGVPRHAGSLWSTYRVPQGPLRGLKLGAGTVIRGRREGDNLNDYRLPGFAKLSALAAYDWRAAGTSFRVQLNVDNLLNKRYFESLSGTRTVIPGASRSWIATLGVEF